MSGEGFKVGDAVLSKAGRDAKRAFVIVEVIGTDWVMLCDGALRKLNKPKRKKVRHIKKLDKIPPFEAVRRGERILDADVRKYLKEQGLTSSKEV
ncbi:MAG: KOW domain-containing RNA-binding protein [Clostridia bacterium]|nr:KOW domain-containing RNA-binding protein [Clostridia bacterium]